MKHALRSTWGSGRAGRTCCLEEKIKSAWEDSEACSVLKDEILSMSLIGLRTRIIFHFCLGGVIDFPRPSPPTQVITPAQALESKATAATDRSRTTVADARSKCARNTHLFIYSEAI